jgi:hypothetical protein
VARLAEGVEDLGGDVGEDAGALGGDAIADEEKQEPGQEVVDVIGGAEFGELIEKIGGKVVRIFLALAKAGVTEAETGTGVQGAELAGTARAGALLATDSALRFAPFAIAPFAMVLGKLGKGQVLRRNGVRCCFLHERTSKKGWRGVYPLVVTDRVRNGMKGKEIKSSPWGHNGTTTEQRWAREERRNQGMDTRREERIRTGRKR